jgi:hypothetical protein
MACLVLPVLLGVSPARGTIEVDGEARVGLGYDSNVFEYVSASRRVADGFALLEGGVSLSARTHGFRKGPNAQLRWGVERYLDERRETRQIVRGNLGWRWGDRRNWFACSWEGALRAFPADEVRDVTRHELSGSARLRLADGGRVLFRTGGAKVLTRAGGPSARESWFASGEYWRRVASQWQLFGRLEAGRPRYDRRIGGECPPGHQIGPYDRQKDNTFLFGIGATRGRAPLLRIFYGFRVTDSNVSSLDFHRHEVRVQVGLMLPAHVSVQILGRWNPTAYREEGCSPVLPQEDSEDPDLWERNSLTVQFRRPLGGNLAAELRGSWQRNEALILGRFYEKTVVHASLRYALGSGG